MVTRTCLYRTGQQTPSVEVSDQSMYLPILSADPLITMYTEWCLFKLLSTSLAKTTEERQRHKMPVKKTKSGKEQELCLIGCSWPPDEDEGDVEESGEERSACREELGRPRTPEPSSMSMYDDNFKCSGRGGAAARGPNHLLKRFEEHTKAPSLFLLHTHIHMHNPSTLPIHLRSHLHS